MYFASAPNYETVPISGRGRYKGPLIVSSVVERQLQSFCDEAQYRLDSTPGLINPDEELDASRLVERIRHVLGKVAHAAGLEDARWTIRLLSDGEITAQILLDVVTC